jgi:DNA-binding MarR family transcriptional regulator
LELNAHRELKVLEAIADDTRLTQRGLSNRLGIALGLTNLYLKRLVRKGHVKCVNVQSNRVLYLLTPKGIAEKARLTYEFMEYSLEVYREGRKHLKTMLKPYAEQPSPRIAIFGTGEAAELAYLCLKELDLVPVVVFDQKASGTFLGVRICDIKEHASVEYDVIIIASMIRTPDPAHVLRSVGVPQEKLLSLREPEAGDPSQREGS